MAAAAADIRTECLSGCRYGELIPIDGTAWNSVTTIHAITQTDAIDSVSLHLFNSDPNDVTVFLVLNPDDDTVQADVDDSTHELVIGGNSDGWVLQADRFRKHGGVTSYTVAAYVAAADVDKVKFTGHFNRLAQVEETA